MVTGADIRKIFQPVVTLVMTHPTIVVGFHGENWEDTETIARSVAGASGLSYEEHPTVKGILARPRQVLWLPTDDGQVLELLVGLRMAPHPMPLHAVLLYPWGDDAPPAERVGHLRALYGSEPIALPLAMPRG